MFGKKTLEKNMRFSKSVLWNYQMQYFANQGINAWTGQVPFFVTSNPNIGITYAKVMFAYIKDMVQQNQYDQSQPFYILELGTGAGKFSFYCLQKLSELIEFEFGNKIKFCYIMSDFTMSNIEFWQQQPQLQAFKTAGMLDFACIDMLEFTELKLLNTNKTLTTQDLTNGLMVAGNYIFDTVPHDAFAVQNGRLFESRCEVTTTSANLKGKLPQNLEKLEVSFAKSLLKSHYPEYDKNLQQVVNEYKEKLHDTHLLIPIAGIKFLEKLADLAAQRLLLISTDKGVTDLSEIEGRGAPHVAFHGSFSMMVNFHAMVRYNELQGGSAALQPCHNGIKTIVMARGFEIKAMPWLAREVATSIQDNSPAQFFHMHRFLRQNPISYGVDVMIPYLINSHWDPYVFALLHKNLLERLSQIPARHLKILDAGMSKIADKIYDMPGDKDPWSLIAMYFILRDLPEQAKFYANKSIEHKGEGSENLIQLGTAILAEKDYESAIKYLQRARDLGADADKINQLLRLAQAGLA